ncbi:TIM-barrel domain-containing protein [Actinoallomurus rhizosphaericola]|uniref:TIM-barrel domain-containing protein n=1 Tax=Actinoallomurus rhizosphaericola TaxID=2952536 RepID=UPI002090B225|nr:TIM-barrel domain-containing protein [Actinoallomurus rhizosphaericola]
MHRRTGSGSRAIRAGLALAGVAGLVVATSSPATASPPGQRADKHAVQSGDARFEVLSPTLIRMEYAGDGAFTDAATFNAVGRDGFGRTQFTKKVEDGWLTIDTGPVKLRYKVGSGPFTADNVSVQVRAADQKVIAHPTFPGAATCATDTLCEAERGLLQGVSVASDHTGFTGTGFAAGFESTGGSLAYTLDVPKDGTYDLRLRYANSQGGDGKTTTRTLSAAIDGGTPATLTMPTTANWDTWAFTSVPGLHLTAGRHTLLISRTANDSGDVNIDSLALTAPGAPYPTTAPSTACDYGTVCEAEAGALAGGAKLAADHNGHSGDGFVAGLERAGASDTVTVRNVPANGSYGLQVRYSNGGGTARTISTAVNGGTATTANLAPTADWDSWSTAVIPVTLAKGTDTIALGCPTADSCHVNLDTVAVAPASSKVLPAHSPLGGYRRGLDGVNGSAVTTPGLLYRDGWYLLDDTPSAIFDPETRTVHARPGHDGKPYQDGYLFGYGQDYKQGLSDLKTLTGPSELLPRWAYGIWFSEYYDFTAADYQNSLLPKFRSEGVPLDVLVTDTDYKAPATWDGWQIDTNKFPDPAAFFAWEHAQGLHSALNIHPSIASGDPQYAQAQATAKGKLAVSGCGAPSGQTCNVFDWGDPDQLSAYFGLHKKMEQQGNDLWWLDWCCDGSQSSLAGVTPDAWINQQYADDTAKRVGRGFAFSRAYSSLQASGYSGQAPVPTGPWADKRTTVHFTGDTASSWDTLKFEVGYTPGESAATGLSAVSHDIGGFNGPSHLADDLYVRWVQMAAFQPILRLHSNHSDRLPWQYGDQARTAAEKFLNLRENLVPYTYTLAKEAADTGVPVVRATYLEYPDEQGAYDASAREYFYGSDVLVAPATSSGTTATTSVWFPPGQWTDYFTGKTYTGPSTQNVTTDWNAMPVFIKAGGILPTRTDNVSNDEQNPLTKVTVNVAGGTDSVFRLYEDDGHSTDPNASATTTIRYTEHGGDHSLRMAPPQGRFSGQVTKRQWTVVFYAATKPTTVQVDGEAAPQGSWTYDDGKGTLTVTLPARKTGAGTTVDYR